MVYSKKVEFLYTLVYHTLDLVAGQKDKGIRRRRGNHDGEDEEDLLETAAEQFLPLDDVIPSAKKVSLQLPKPCLDSTKAPKTLLERTPFALSCTSGAGAGAGSVGLKMMACAMHTSSGALMLEKSSLWRFKSTFDMHPVVTENKQYASSGVGFAFPQASLGSNNVDGNDDDDDFGDDFGGADDGFDGDDDHVGGARSASCNGSGAAQR